MTLPDDTGTHVPPIRPQYRVPIGLPLRDEGRREGAIVSVLVHVIIVGLLLMPLYYASTVLTAIPQGAGGAGPPGGGGGGNGGGNGYHETLRFVRVAAEPVPTPTKVPQVPPPVVPKPVPVIPALQQPVVKSPEQSAVPAPMQTVAALGAGPGSGRDGSAGNGPGSGGGTGSGIGTGRGGGIGPGTGGGTQVNYPPQPIEIFLPPLPPPSSVRGFQFIATFDVDSTGRVLDVKFSETRDGDYNRRLASILRLMRWRPGTRPDGTPLRMLAQVSWEF